MSDIVEFLQARLDEDEAVAREAVAEREKVRPDWTEDYGSSALDWPPLVAVGPERWLAEVETKRRILEMCEPLAQWEVRRQTRNLAQGTLRELARPYRDHPGYDPAWGV